MLQTSTQATRGQEGRRSPPPMNPRKPEKSHQRLANLLERNRIFDREENGLMEGGIGTLTHWPKTDSRKCYFTLYIKSP
ncbi:hypothetical protein EVAR_82217_1 [Eumeta japonica]|uniref:Uncharacterized protein n=1 Tax=Eumeta variegata TaxID=151549 RepID=A0A4C1W4F5_EUMVA|nr:hypothetical protein EVAR_82217_1 [Eumeta japonica]